MKAILPVGFMLIVLSVAGQSPGKDTTIRGVPVQFSSGISIFPTSWQGNPINAQAIPVTTREVARCKKIAAMALNKYPSEALLKDLKGIYFLSSLTFYNVGYGGTNSNDKLYLTNNGVAAGYTDLYLEQTFHHEYSSILYRNYPQFLDTTAWLSANTPGFDYNDPENGVGAIRNNQSSQEFDSVLCDRGFLTEYSQSGMENDINTFAQNLFSPSDGFWELVNKYPRIRQKTRLLIEFYNKIHPLFTQRYFRSFAQ